MGGTASSNITVTGFSAHDNKGDGIGIIAGNNLQSGNTAIIIQNSSFYNNSGGPNPDSGIRLDTNTNNVTIKYNKLYGNQSAGVVAEDGAHDNAILYNLSYLNARGITHSNNSGTGNVYYGNTLYGNTLDGFQVYASTNPATIKNNIFATNGRYGYSTDGGSHVVDYNLSDGNAIADYSGITKPANDATGDPRFKNAATGDFTLLPGSPAIDAGVDLGPAYRMGLAPGTSFPTSTLNQDNQGSGWEIGAFVFVRQMPPSPPTSISVTVR